MRPLITFLLVAYNQERFVKKAVEGALSQTYSPLEIILSDDCSTDKTLEVMVQSVEGYQGPHEVTVLKNEKNLGVGEHINRAMEKVRGELIVGAAGDDVSLPHRVETLLNAYIASGGKALSIYSNEHLIDEFDNRHGYTLQNPPEPRLLTLDWFTRRQAAVLGSTHMWHRKTFDFFGPMDSDVISEDAVIPYRSLLLGSIEYIDEPLVLRRFTGQNLYLVSDKIRRSRQDASLLAAFKLRHAKNFSAVYRTRLRDIEQMVCAHPEKSQEMSFVKTITQKKLDQANLEMDFWSSGKRNRGVILLKLLQKKRAFTKAADLAVAWTMPALHSTLRQLFYRVTRRR